MKVLNRNAAIAVTRPNWSGGVGIEYSFKTGIYTSRNGTEQREALRQTPRVALKFPTVLTREGILRHSADMASNQLDPIAVRAEWDRAEIATDVLLGAFTFDVVDAPHWLYPGVTLILTDEDNEELVEVTDVASTTVTIDTATSRAFSAGTRVHLAYWTRPPEEMAFVASTSMLWTSSARYDVLPGLPKNPCPSRMPLFYKGHELFVTKPNWRDLPKVTFSQIRDTFDPGVGTVGVSAPEKGNHMRLQLGYSQTNYADASDLIEFFMRKKGRRTSFWMPTWSRDILPSATATVAANTFQIDGTDFLTAYSGDAVFQAMIMFNPDGTYQANRLVSMAGAVDSELTFQDDWTESVVPSSRIMWLPLWRFDTDTLDVRWLTDQIAEAQFSVKTLFADFNDAEIIVPVHTGLMAVPTILGDVIDLYDYCITQEEIDAGDIKVQTAWSGLYHGLEVIGDYDSNVSLAVNFHAVAPVNWYDASIAPVPGDVVTFLETQITNLSASLGPLTVPPGARYVQFRASYTSGVGATLTLDNSYLSAGRLIQEGPP